MIKIIFLVMLPLAWSYGPPNSQGGGAFAYVDSSGHRYGGTYGLKDGRVVSRTGDPIPQHFADNIPYPQHFVDNAYYPDEDDFGPAYFENLENLLQEVFNKNLESQRLAFNAARKAFDLTSNQAGGYFGGYYPNPNIASRFPSFPRFPAYSIPPMNFGNTAFAGAAARPGYQHHVASIYPSNPKIPNVDEIKHYSDKSAPNNGYYSVSSSSYASSSNVNGQESAKRGAETVVNDNGKITHYKVES